MAEQDRGLQQLLDRAAIEHILTLYPRAIDRRDLDLLLSLYHPDARDEHASFHGTAREFAEHVIQHMLIFKNTMHHVTHWNIEVHGDHAASEAYYYAHHLMAGDEEKVTNFFGPTYARQCREAGTLDGEHEFICGGRYLDLFSKHLGEWRIATREITVEWKHFRPAVEGDPGSHIARIVAPPGRDRNDIAYRFMERARLAGKGG